MTLAGQSFEQLQARQNDLLVKLAEVSDAMRQWRRAQNASLRTQIEAELAREARGSLEPEDAYPFG